MSTMTYVILALVIIVVAGAAYIVYNDRKKGKNSCGCSCSECGTGCASPMVTMPEEESAEESDGSDDDSAVPDEPEEKV